MPAGEVFYRDAGQAYRLTRGDSPVFDADAPHGPEELIVLSIRFLSIIAYAREERG